MRLELQRPVRRPLASPSPRAAKSRIEFHRADRGHYRPMSPNWLRRCRARVARALKRSRPSSGRSRNLSWRAELRVCCGSNLHVERLSPARTGAKSAAYSERRGRFLRWTREQPLMNPIVERAKFQAVGMQVPRSCWTTLEPCWSPCRGRMLSARCSWPASVLCRRSGRDGRVGSLTSLQSTQPFCSDGCREA
jgi:hypothetical protein